MRQFCDEALNTRIGYLSVSIVGFVMEESLREAACVGDLASVTKLIQAGVDVNSANKINGW